MHHRVVSSSSPAAIGLDVGGHGVRAVLVSQSGQILAEDEAWIDGVEGRSIEEVEAIKITQS